MAQAQATSSMDLFFNFQGVADGKAKSLLDAYIQDNFDAQAQKTVLSATAARSLEAEIARTMRAYFHETDMHVHFLGISDPKEFDQYLDNKAKRALAEAVVRHNTQTRCVPRMASYCRVEV